MGQRACRIGQRQRVQRGVEQHQAQVPPVAVGPAAVPRLGEQLPGAPGVALHQKGERQHDLRGHHLGVDRVQ